jgi:hypothetical protein
VDHGAIPDQVSEFLNVPRSHGNPVGQLLGEDVRDADLVDRNVRVWSRIYETISAEIYR